jgi:hypothetical protein
MRLFHTRRFKNGKHLLYRSSCIIQFYLRIHGILIILIMNLFNH